MRLDVFQAGKGDCLLLTAKDGTRVLVDGGMRDDYRKHVAPALARLRRDDSALDLVYLSHIDRDHISGIPQLMDDRSPGASSTISAAATTTTPSRPSLVHRRSATSGTTLSANSSAPTGARSRRRLRLGPVCWPRRTIQTHDPWPSVSKSSQRASRRASSSHGERAPTSWAYR